MTRSHFEPIHLKRRHGADHKKSMVPSSVEVDIWRARWADAGAIAARQQRRLSELLRYARQHSQFYRRHHADLPSEPGALSAMPPVTKPMVMEHFDEVVTDPEVTRAGVEAFIADQANIGRRLLGRYPVWTTSGTTGEPGIFLQDDLSLQLVHTVPDRWTTPALLRPKMISRLVRNNFRGAEIAVTGGHFAGASGIALIQRESRFLGSRIRMFSPDLPIDELIEELGAFSPASITGYSTVLVELARAASDGRLAITPAMIAASGEAISRADKRKLRGAFECVVRELYGATEGVVLAMECGSGSLHVNSDWFVLEPVDNDRRPVPPGQLSDTVLLTNLGNRIQPLIRYDLGDSIVLHQHACACGSAFPVIEVQGRQGEVLVFSTDRGTKTPIFPLALSGVVEGVAGVARCQIVRVSQTALEVRMEVAPDHPRATVWSRVRQALAQFFDAHGVHDVEIRPGIQPPRRNPHSGKFSHVWSEQP